LTELLQKRAVSVDHQGEVVTLKVSDVTWSFEFVVALELAAMIKREARYAKASPLAMKAFGGTLPASCTTRPRSGFNPHARSAYPHVSRLATSR
jgi:hypothetical protein